MNVSFFLVTNKNKKITKKRVMIKMKVYTPKIIIKNDWNDFECMEYDLLSDEVTFPDDLIAKGKYTPKEFLKDVIINALDELKDAVIKIYLDTTSNSKISIQINEKAWENNEIYLEVIRRLVNIFRYPFKIETIF